MRIALLANEASGSGCQPADLERMLSGHGARVSTFRIEEMHAAGATRPQRIVVAGGDGSLAPVAAVAAEAGAMLAVIPSGTANDFARRFDLPTDTAEACRLAATGTEARSLELARMDGRPFLNVASAGLAAAAAREARSWKQRLGVLAYVIGAARAGIGASPIEARVVADESVFFDGRAWQVIVSSTGRFGAGSSAGPANPSDGQLDVTVIEARSRLRLIKHAYGLRFGEVVDHDGVHHVRGHEIRLEVPDGTGFNVDGEILSRGAASFSAEKDAFALVVG